MSAIRVSAIQYQQPADTCSSAEQFLDARIIDGGGGAFVVLSTKRWAIEPDQLRKLADELDKLTKAYDAAENDEECKP